MEKETKTESARIRSRVSLALSHLFSGFVALILAACSAGTTTPPQTASIAPVVSPKAAATNPPAVQTPATQIPTLQPPTPIASATSSPDFPDPSGYAWLPVVSGLNLPVDIQNAADGSDRLFIVEKRGLILIFQKGQLLPVPFLDIQAEVGSQHTEQGLLGLAFHPDYAKTGSFFVNYTDLNGNTVIARFQVSATDPNRADPGSQVDILRIAQPFANHNGGGLAFGPDGYLYIGLGDGGSEGDPLRNGQNLQTLLGKMLRIDIDHGDKYSIPADNPFAHGGGLPEIWAYGLRNPWRFSFDHANGDLYIADVGQDRWEEVDLVKAGTRPGLNFGWSYFEGFHAYQDTPPPNVVFIQPAYEYSHDFGCAITGGHVYRGQSIPEWQGVYFFGDYCSGNIWGLVKAGQAGQHAKLLFTTRAQITTFGVDGAGEIYISDFGTGSILRLSKRQ